MKYLTEVEFTNTPTAPTPSIGTNNTQLATTAFVQSLVQGRNVLINGDFAIDQYNEGAAQTIIAGAAKVYPIDRWYAYCTGANVTGQRIAGSGESQFRYRFTGAASNTNIQFGQRIETTNSYHLNGKTCVLSVDLANSLLTTVTWTAYYANTINTFGTIASPTRTQIATGTFTVSSTLARYSTQITIPSAATTGIEIVLSVANQTSGTWTIGDMQWELGSVATPFERKQNQYSLCQLYLCKSYNSGVIAGTITDSGCVGGRQSGANLVFDCLFGGKMIAIPNVVFYNPVTGATGAWRDRNANTNLTVALGAGTAISQHAAPVTITGTDGNLINGHWVAQAEL